MYVTLQAFLLYSVNEDKEFSITYPLHMAIDANFTFTIHTTYEDSTDRIWTDG